MEANQLRGLHFTSPLHGNFLALLAGLDLASMCYKRTSPSECVYLEDFQPF